MINETIQSPTTLVHHLSREPAVLDRIADAGTNLSVWQRNPDPDIALELNSLFSPKWRDVRQLTSVGSFDADVRAHLIQQGAAPEQLGYFCADLRKLANIFFRICRGLQVNFRLFTSDEDDCRRFHVDYRYLRLICTYQGAGTEWLTNDQVDREAYERGAPNTAIVRYGIPNHLESFWVGIFKDDACPGNTGNGLMHRSPPASASKRERVVFCLDASRRR